MRCGGKSRGGGGAAAENSCLQASEACWWGGCSATGWLGGGGGAGGGWLSSTSASEDATVAPLHLGSCWWAKGSGSVAGSGSWWRSCSSRRQRFLQAEGDFPSCAVISCEASSGRCGGLCRSGAVEGRWWRRGRRAAEVLQQWWRERDRGPSVYYYCLQRANFNFVCSRLSIFQRLQ